MRDGSAPPQVLARSVAVEYIRRISVDVPLLQPGAESADLLSERAYYRLRELIVSLELRPGTPLDERDLIARVGVGRTPIREALQALAREGLVEAYPRRGMAVAPVDAGQLASLAEVRVALEGYAARLAAERATPDERVETSALRAALERAAGEQDRRTLIELDQRIHRHVYACTHNGLLADALDRYYVLTLRIWFLALDRVPRLDEAVQEHQALLAAIRDRHPARAERVAREHVLAFERAIREVL